MEPATPSFQFQSLLKDQELVEEVRERIARGRLRGLRRAGVGPDIIEAEVERGLGVVNRESVPMGASGLNFAPSPPRPDEFTREAIVLEFGRPSLIVQNGTYQLPESPTWRRDLALHRTNVENAIARVGRVELIGHLTFDWVGTAWVVAPNVVVTNRHVAETFVERRGGGLVFSKNLMGQDIGVQVDFREEHDVQEVEEFRVSRVLYMADPGTQNPDMALLELETAAELPEPLPMATGEVEDRQMIGIVGYPAFDSRNGEDVMRRYFGDIYDVKRFAPGRVSFPTEQEHYFVHDCTTLGGNSGSLVFDLESGEVVGLHFAGQFRTGNFAVKSRLVQEALAGVSVPVPGDPGPTDPTPTDPTSVPDPLADGTHDTEHFADRPGYQADFLGADFSVPLPGLGPWLDDAAAVSGAPAETPYVLRYQHFSVVVSERRRLPILTAVNIDGSEARRVPGRRGWYLDGRIGRAFQAGNELYRHNDLDRGHMVRRLDPVWGPPEIAKVANDDTFHYVNACPQHKDLNQREWLRLEDYILDNADALDFKVSVMTGPVLQEDDRTYRDVQLPRKYWKVAVLVNGERRQLSATAYLLSQEQMLDDLEEAAFLFGRFKTYQIPITQVESLTGLDFGDLSKWDPLAASDGEESHGVRRRLIDTGEDIIF